MNKDKNCSLPELRYQYRTSVLATVCFLAFITFLFTTAILFSSQAKADIKTPLEVVKTGINQAKSVIDNPSLKYEDKRKQLHDILLPFFETQEMSRRVLGANFKKYEKRFPEFTPLFIDLIENSYLRLSTLDSAKEAKVVYGKQTIDGNYADVETKIISKNGNNTPVAYRLVLKDGEWKVFDIMIEGVSLVSNYRSQVNRILNEGSSGARDPFDVLLDRIREKIAEAKAADK